VSGCFFYLSFLDSWSSQAGYDDVSGVFFLHLEVVFAEECLLVIGVYFIYV
jgi:hypothetical protein